MPELPEVETVVRAIRPNITNRPIRSFWCDWPNQLVTHDDSAVFAAQIVGQTVVTVRRRAKYIVMPLSGGDTLMVHLKMTGHLAVVPASAAQDKYVHVKWGLDNDEELRFRDIRKFGRIYLTDQPETFLGKLGPEPLEPSFTADVLAQRLGSRSRAIKPTLLDQTIVAGIGNIYADEALFDAKIHPRTPTNRLQPAQIVALHAAIRKVLQLGIDREGASITNYVKPDGQKGEMQDAVMVFRRTDFPCYQCGTPIARIVLTQRSTHFCPSCQPASA